MNRKLSFVAIILATTFAYAMGKTSGKVLFNHYFLFTGNTYGDMFYPAAWEEVPYIFDTDCPGSDNMCGMSVPEQDIHTSGPYQGLPKVNVQTSAVNELSDDITLAMLSILDPYYGNFGRVIYKKY